jgi:glucokinase
MKIGIDLGGSHIAVGIISERNTIIAQKEQDIIDITKIENIKNYIVDNIIILTRNLLKEVGAPSCVITEIGIGAPGKVKNNIIYNMYNLGIEEFNLAELLADYYKVDVKIKNDAKCAAIAEKNQGSLKEYDDCIFMCLGTGIGGATFINGKMLEQTKEIGSEYGHMIIQKDGKQCNCGNKGCYEKYASMKAFKEGLKERLNLDNNIESKEILKILKDRVNVRDEETNKYIDEYIDYLILGISNICNILEPEAICLGGSFVYFEDILYKRLVEKINLKKYKFNVPKIVLAKLGNDATLIGTSYL